MPYHNVQLSGEETVEWVRWDEFKRRLAVLAAETSSANIIDFMILSQITTRDENYWDALHYPVAVADRLAELISVGVNERRGQPGLFIYIEPK